MQFQGRRAAPEPGRRRAATRSISGAIRHPAREALSDAPVVRGAYFDTERSFQ